MSMYSQVKNLSSLCGWGLRGKRGKEGKRFIEKSKCLAVKNSFSSHQNVPSRDALQGEGKEALIPRLSHSISCRGKGRELRKEKVDKFL